MNGLAAEKAAMRVEMIARRAAFPPCDGKMLAKVALAELSVPSDSTVAGVWPLLGELDLRPLLEALYAKGCIIVLPRTPPRGDALVFRLWQPGCAMLPGRFGTWFPETSKEAMPTILFVPFLAFDRHGGRLGYGAGYYDRTLAGLPGARRIGFGFAAQEVPRVPAGPHDMRMDTVVTERELISIRSAAGS